MSYSYYFGYRKKVVFPYTEDHWCLVSLWKDLVWFQIIWFGKLILHLIKFPFNWISELIVCMALISTILSFLQKILENVKYYFSSSFLGFSVLQNLQRVDQTAVEVLLCCYLTFISFHTTLKSSTSYKTLPRFLG